MLVLLGDDLVVSEYATCVHRMLCISYISNKAFLLIPKKEKRKKTTNWDLKKITPKVSLFLFSFLV